jgi:hypothetical protein
MFLVRLRIIIESRVKTPVGTPQNPYEHQETHDQRNARNARSHPRESRAAPLGYSQLYIHHTHTSLAPVVVLSILDGARLFLLC